MGEWWGGAGGGRRRVGRDMVVVLSVTKVSRGDVKVGYFVG